ncbi:hypothetical protein KQH60_00055 [Mycetohabitans sp. B8]|uniref:hypothetical protein n=1 Tax=Mycetohabitans sp. B8 TaxID=2841845 RepID=UPI001F236EE7|nr:hypothetical protein [Mycetohabitans sp. B8]MCG1041043.1 hypothetical protein [Mycetohabitans sp. B8]
MPPSTGRHGNELHPLAFAVPQRGRREVSLHGADNSDAMAVVLDVCDALFDITGHCREMPRD